MIHKDIAPPDMSGHVRALSAALRAQHAVAHRTQQSDAAVTLAGTVWWGGGTVAIRNTSDITHFRLRNMNFFHNSLEIIFRNINNLFLTSIISLQATFEI